MPRQRRRAANYRSKRGLVNGNGLLQRDDHVHFRIPSSKKKKWLAAARGARLDLTAFIENHIDAVVDR
jgi:hypothetical protein